MKIGVSLVGISHLDYEKIDLLDGNSRIGGIRNHDRCLVNIQETVIDSLKRQSEVSVYATTYAHSELNKLIEMYKPKKMCVLDYANSRMQQTYISSLEQLIDEDFDLLISTRFDIRFKRDLDVTNIPMNKVTSLFRERGYSTYTDDNIFFIPKSLIGSFILAIKTMIDVGGKPNGMHNAIHYMASLFGEDTVNIYDGESQLGHDNKYYFLPRYSEEYIARGEL
jgi:hypothetical protein